MSVTTTTATLTPNMAGTISSTSVEIISGTVVKLLSDSEGLFVPPAYEEVYATSPATEGGARVRSRPENVVGQGRVLIEGTDGTALWEKVSTWEQTLENCRKYGGSLLYEPEDGASITYEVASARMVSLPQRGVDIIQNRAESEFELTYRPYGLLAPGTVVAGTATTPLLELDVPQTDGSVDGLGSLNFIENSSQDRDHIEWGLESRFYNDSTLLTLGEDMTAFTGASQKTRTGSYGTTVLRGTLTTASSPIGYFTDSHVGRWRVKARAFPSSGTVSLRMGWAVRGGDTSFSPWEVLPGTATSWYEVQLGVANITPAPPSTSHSMTFSLYGKVTAGTKTVDIDYVKTFPAERYGLAHGTIGAVSTLPSGGTARIRHEAFETQVTTNVWAHHSGYEGAYLRIPNAGGRIACAANRADIETEAHGTLGDSLIAELVVTPRVALLGE